MQLKKNITKNIKGEKNEKEIQRNFRRTDYGRNERTKGAWF